MGFTWETPDHPFRTTSISPTHPPTHPKQGNSSCPFIGGPSVLLTSGPLRSSVLFDGPNPLSGPESRSQQPFPSQDQRTSTVILVLPPISVRFSKRTMLGKNGASTLGIISDFPWFRTSRAKTRHGHLRPRFLRQIGRAGACTMVLRRALAGCDLEPKVPSRLLSAPLLKV